jgi:hypothetical protein
VKRKMEGGLAVASPVLARVYQVNACELGGPGAACLGADLGRRLGLVDARNYQLDYPPPLPRLPSTPSSCCQRRWLDTSSAARQVNSNVLALNLHVCGSSAVNARIDLTLPLSAPVPSLNSARFRTPPFLFPGLRCVKCTLP